MILFAGPGAWWLRVVAWAGVIVVSVLSTPSTAARIVTGATLAVAAVAVQFARADSATLRRAAVALAAAGGFAACFAAHDGLAEVPILLAAARLPEVSDGVALRWLTGFGAVAFAGTIAFISRSYAGLLSGVAVPLLVQRAVEHRDLIRERDRAQALLAEVQAGREAEAQAAALQERGRIAREMHDVLAHSLAGLSVQLQAVRAVAAREGVGPAVLDPLDRAAALARDGVAEARAAVTALRDPVGLGLADLAALVERHPGAATLTVTGEPGEVSAEAGHAVYRAVQEALTNAARYAPGSPVAVELAWTDGALAVEVRDDGPGPDRTAVAGAGTGLGLAGMDERLRAVGGRLRAGPRPGRGWRIELSVPGAGS
ncbi:MAG TPA: ATP-binding protein [Jatrophihabitans sp.]|nr:ATP-binding protein [Jatrophihabitans sp.]